LRSEPWPAVPRISAPRLALALSFAVVVALVEAAAISTPARGAIAVALQALASFLAQRRSLGSYLLQMAFLVAAFGIETLRLGWSASSARRLACGRSASAFADLVSFVLLHAHLADLAARLTGVALVSAGVLQLRAVLAVPWPALLHPHGQPFLLEYAECFVVLGFFEYWCHRIQHFDLFWPLHRFHHSADEFVILTAARKHPLEVWPELITASATVLLIGSRWEVVLAVQFTHTLINYFRHARLAWSYGWLGRYLVQSPVHHRLHHERRADGRSVNLAIMPLWDHLFGTWGEPEPADPVLGVLYPYRQGAGVFADLWRDAAEFLAGMRPAAWRRPVTAPASSGADGRPPPAG